MKIEKVCEYLNEIGILEYENINMFLEIYSKLNTDKYLRARDRLRDTLVIYLNNNYIKNNQLSQLCQSILFSYNNYQLILKYRTLHNMNNILTNKIHNKYISFFLNLSFFLLKKKTSKRSISSKKNKIAKKRISKKSDKYDDSEDKGQLNEENNTELISSDEERECTFAPQINKNFKGYKKPNYNNVESKVYYSPAINITSKFPLNNYQNNIPIRNVNNNSHFNYNYNNYNNNNQISINNNNNISDNSYYSNYSNYTNYKNNYNNKLEISNDNRSNRSYKFNDNILKELNNDYINNNYQNRFLQSNNDYDYNNDILRNYNNLNINNNRYIYNNNYNYSNTIGNHNDFFNKELEHIQRVKDKIQNMRIEKMNKIKEECTFQPTINTNYKSFYSNNKQNENYLNNLNQQSRQLPQQPQPQYTPLNKNSLKNINSNNKSNSSKKIIQLKRKEPLKTIKENDNINQNSVVIKKKKEKENKKRCYSEKKKGIKIIEDLSLARKRRTEKTKKLMKERNFTPKIKKSDKYKNNITMSFEDRRLKSIELKNKYKKAKNDENKIKNNDILVLAPSEMVRFKENSCNNFNDNANNNNNISNNIEERNEDKKVDNNDYQCNKEENNKINENHDNIEDNESLAKKVNIKDIEKNKLLLMDKIKGEHKIGFKLKKEIEENEEKDNINNNVNIENKNEEIINDINLEKNEEKEISEDYENNLINKEDEFSFNANKFNSNALKSILDKNKKEN